MCWEQGKKTGWSGAINSPPPEACSLPEHKLKLSPKSCGGVFNYDTRNGSAIDGQGPVLWSLCYRMEPDSIFKETSLIYRSGLLQPPKPPLPIGICVPSTKRPSLGTLSEILSATPPISLGWCSQVAFQTLRGWQAHGSFLLTWSHSPGWGYIPS